LLENDQLTAWKKISKNCRIQLLVTVIFHELNKIAEKVCNDVLFVQLFVFEFSSHTERQMISI